MKGTLMKDRPLREISAATGESPPRTRPTRRWLIGMAAVFAIVVAACGGDTETTSAVPDVVETASEGTSSNSSDTADSASSATEVSADATDEELALAFASCMRDEGVDFEDPTVNADGTINLGRGGGGGGGGGFADENFQGAFETCGDLLDGAAFLGGGRDRAEAEDQFLALAQCLRDQGLDVDDPDLSGGFAPGRGLFGEDFDPQDPANADAIEVCQGLVDFGGAAGGA